MNALAPVLSPYTPNKRIIVVSACSAKKVFSPNGLLKENDLDDPVRRKQGEARLKSYRLPAGEMYKGDGHKFVLETVRTLRTHGHPTSHFILSAGYGLLHETDLIVPYNVTFNKAQTAWIKERGQRLNLRGQLITKANKYDWLILILGRKYYQAIGLPLPVGSLPPVITYIAPTLINYVGRNVRAISVGEAERREISAYSSSAKEKRFLLDVRNALGLRP